MGKPEKTGPRFSASKRDFLKRTALFGIYIGPLIRTFEMAEIAAKPTGPPKMKKKTETSGRAPLRSNGRKRTLA